MITVRKYEKPKTVEEAYTLLKSNKNSALIGGGAFLKLGSKNISTAIDLSEAGLNYIKETEEHIEIGAMTTFHELERNQIINEFSHGMLGQSVKDIVGIQMRNMVTIGATIYSRYGFSDLITGLLALDVEVKLFNNGIVSLEEFLTNGTEESDVLEYILIKKNEQLASFKSIRKSKADYAVLNLAVSKTKDSVRVSVGARPNRAVLATKTSEYITIHGISDKTITEAGKILAEELVFGSNMRGTAEYRKSVAPALLKRAITEVMSYEY